MDRIKNKALFIEQGFVAGEWTGQSNSNRFEVFNPATLTALGSLPNMGADETNEAILSAHQAFQTWKKSTANERYAILNRWYELIMQNTEDLASLMVLEQGKPLAEARGEVAYSAKFSQWFSEQAKRIHGSIMSNYSDSAQLQFTKEPVGVVGVITPWNFPLAMITRKVAPALAAGCCVVIKASASTPYSALALVKLLEQAGLPQNVCQIVTSNQSSVIGQTMSASDLVRKISFTGSTRVGKILLEQSASTVKRMSMELGGNAPFIVFDDADMTTAIKAVIATKYRNTGQTCVCANRIFVHSKIYDEFAERLQQEVGKFIVADGFTEGVNQGPLINDAAREKVEAHIQNSVASGAEVLMGGKHHERGGNFFEPTILANVAADAIFSCEETFGPVAPLITFDDEAQVLEQANATEFGLSAYFCTQDFRRIKRVLEGLESGMVGVNEGILSNEFGPFGGVKSSGIGREGSIYGIDEYLEHKYALISYA